jgi:hypothetical protein
MTYRLRRMIAAALALGLAVTSCGSGGDDGDLEGLLTHINALRIEREAQPWDSTKREGFTVYVELTRGECDSSTRQAASYEKALEEDGPEGAQFYVDRLAFICPDVALALEAQFAGRPDPDVAPGPTVVTDSTPPLTTG